MAFYRICPDCERIWIRENGAVARRTPDRKERKEKATAFVEKMVKEERNGQLRLAV